jgi:hypothetical protein
MNYELAKKLKEAGFPQKESNLLNKTISVGFSTDINNPNTCFYFPTLSELIKECIHFWKLTNIGTNFWEARSCFGKYECIGLGDTPEESIANLWLKLVKENKNEYEYFNKLKK